VQQLLAVDVPASLPLKASDEASEGAVESAARVATEVEALSDLRGQPHRSTDGVLVAT